MVRHRSVITALALWGATAALGANAAEPKDETTVGMTPSYFTGDYGTGATTKIWYLPFYARVKHNDWRFKATVPLIRVDSQNTVVSGGSVVARGGGTRSVSGLGDIWLEGRYVFHNRGSAPDVVPYLKMKLGTASRSKGLGTGENDVESGLGLEWYVAPSLFPFARVGYRFVGSPPGLPLNNVLTYEGGATLAVHTRNYLTGFLYGHQSQQSGFAAPLDVMVAWDTKLTDRRGAQVYVDKGLSNGSPNYGFGVGLYAHF